MAVLAKPLLSNGDSGASLPAGNTASGDTPLGPDAAKFNFDPAYNNLYKRQPIR